MLPMMHGLDLDAFLSDRPHGDTPPWSTGDSIAIENRLRRMVESIAKATRSEVHAEFGHYGSGYASFVEAFLSQDNEAFHVPWQSGRAVTGVWLALSRLSRVFCVGSGIRTWGDDGSSSSSMPCLEDVDDFREPHLMAFAHRLISVPELTVWRRLTTFELASQLPAGRFVHTNLGDGHSVFDAVFHWED